MGKRHLRNFYFVFSSHPDAQTTALKISIVHVFDLISKSISSNSDQCCCPDVDLNYIFQLGNSCIQGFSINYFKKQLLQLNNYNY